GVFLRAPARCARAGRVFLVGDFLDCTPGALAGLARPSRELCLAVILAREELVPGERHVRWIDAESGAQRDLAVHRAGALSYERRVSARLGRWRAAAVRARAAFGVWTSASPFETLVGALLARAG